MPGPVRHNSGMSQETLKILACLSMFLDHTGAILVYAMFQDAVLAGRSAGAILDFYELLRTVGRLAFPIYCFLLSEGSSHTHSPKRYALRLFFAALLSEVPFDLALHNTFSWQNQSVMVTLLLGFLALEGMKRCPKVILKLLVALPFAVLAEWMNTDYGANGIWVIVLFSLTRECPRKRLIQFFGMWCIFSPNHLMMLNWLGGFSLTVQELAVLSLIPISLYSGEKQNHSRALQWAFYLFYPAHLALLWILKEVLYG